VRAPVPFEVLLRCAGELASPERRAEAARGLAHHAGAEELIVFVHDEAVGRSLPAPGFPRTLRGGRAWRALVDEAIANGTASAVVTAADGREVAAHAIALQDGTAAVFLGGTFDGDAVEGLRAVLPLAGAMFRLESTAAHAEAESKLARDAATQAASLAAKLDTTRGDLQRALAVAESATRARDEFLATVSHELRTPLTSIIGWIQLLREDNDPTWMAEGLDTIERNARAQSRLIEDILDFSRITAGKLRLDVRSIDLMDVARDAVEIVRPAADAKGVRLESVLDPNAGQISGDPDRLQQVLWNLLSNAVKFTPRGGAVHVRLQRVDSQCELSICDSGEGIAREFLPYVFDRFSQADNSSTRTHSGLGLGLGIVRHLVELHGGTVHAFSEGLGTGSTFAVRLPLVATLPIGEEKQEEVATMVVAPSGVDPLADLTGARILVVEDNDDARRLLETILRRCGATVYAAENVDVALRILEKMRADILVSDIGLPGQDGYSLIRRIRLTEPETGRMPAIALTAYTRSVDRVRALAAGFQMHLAKPVEPSELTAAVKSLLTTAARG
jgi:signal transduction histidine kinase/ActR/RegA family two-component response regulator